MIKHIIATAAAALFAGLAFAVDGTPVVATANIPVSGSGTNAIVQVALGGRGIQSAIPASFTVVGGTTNSTVTVTSTDAAGKVWTWAAAGTACKTNTALVAQPPAAWLYGGGKLTLTFSEGKGGKVFVYGSQFK